MSVIQVQSPGLLTTVQDLGREGFGPLGVSASGAADAIALRVGKPAPTLELRWTAHLSRCGLLSK